ncbi:hypothetical protein FC07_GL002870 [Loigolactobacillus bifermentans DSM 20003]|jgi:hypothetical protein|uniref:Uncharacterized protein n=1 Tax=Loigolactobacillus bifermentans DSM 20003 TaxID=1423726 RepID=A0A0R1H0Z0_9LACO|nr:hypothetical protein FC07_GL002870 [Loigolactobacillus bifermentans DSM 20003]
MKEKASKQSIWVVSSHYTANSEKHNMVGSKIKVILKFKLILTSVKNIRST